MTSLKKFPLIILLVVGLSEAQSPLFVVNKLTSIGRQAHDSGNIIIHNLPWLNIYYLEILAHLVCK